jgi:predicted deacylase
MLDTLRKQIIPNSIAKCKLLPKRYVFGGLFILALLIATVACWPRQVEFSYQQKTCISQFLVAPGLLRSSSDHFKIEPDKPVKLGGVTLAASGVCIIPTSVPQPGKYHETLSLFGVAFVGKQFTVNVKPHPLASTAALERPIPVSRTLRIPLNTADTVFSYTLAVNGKSLQCQSKQQAISCDLPKLDLDQGATYPLRLERYFSGKKVTTIVDKKITTLSAATVQDTSIKRDETVYAKPKSIDVLLDKSLAKAHTTLIKIEGDKKETLRSEATIKDKSVTVTWSDDLARQATYQLVIDSVEASDGSGLVEPYILPFTTSGGPKVKAISVGKSEVPMGTTAVITFDQPVSEKQDISKIITASGGATISGRKGTQVFVNFAAVPKCGDVTIGITNDLQSNYDIAGGSAWSFTTRTICYTVGSIGTSSKGRAITAYYFGNGPSTVVYTGAIHGNEISTRSLMLRWIDELEANARAIPADKNVVIVPAINPDGVASGARVNGNNIDLNRNFGTNDWKKDITTVTNAPFPGGGGPSAMSEPETRAIAGLVSRLRPRLVLSYHSIGSVAAANQTGNSSSLASTYANLSGYSNATGSGTTFEYAISGTADDYYGEKLGVPSILIELGSHTYNQFERNQKAMWAMLRS